MITPLFGGGAIAGERDEVTVVRGTEIRGHLRFWWRACYGGRYNTVKEMKQDEDRIWGAASHSKKDEKEEKKPDKTVQIMVEAIGLESIQENPPYKITKSATGNNKVISIHSIPGYAAFPFRPPQKEINNPTLPLIKPVFDKVRFRLFISFPATVQKDIAGALWAWETFGGIGARTRRGFGAIKLDRAEWIEQEGEIKKHIQIEHVLPIATTKDVKDWIAKEFSYFGIEKKASPDVPSLSTKMQIEVINFNIDARGTWNRLIDTLSNFRQQRSGSQRDKRNAGRSLWPEAEAIRANTGDRDEEKYKALPHPHKFPRAAFGLPINFHFKDNKDPEDTTLQGSKEGHDRFASPLILRPLWCQSNKVVGLAIVLESSTLPDEKLILKGTESKKEYSVSAKLENNEVKAVSPLGGEPDVLRAFMQYLRTSSQGNNQNNNSWRGNNR